MGKSNHLTRIPTAYILISVSVVIAAGFLEVSRPINHDVAWGIAIAEQMADGRALYVDIIEINPPLIFWLSRLLYGTGNGELAYRGLVLCLGLLSALWVYRHCGDWLPSLVLLLSALVVVGGDFGQRDAIVALLLAPLISMAAGTSDNKSAIPLGITAGLAICLKPHYVIVWLLLAPFIRRSTVHLVIAVTGLTYLALVLLLTPEYFTLVQRFGPVYGGFADRDWSFWLRVEPVVLPLLLAVAWLSARRFGNLPRWVGPFIIAGVGGALAFVAQGKGFSYHRIPGFSFAAVGGIGLIIRGNRRAIASGFLPTTLLLLHMCGPAWAMTATDASEIIARNQLRRELPGTLFLSYYTQHGFPWAKEAGLPWLASVPNLWWARVSGHEAAKADLYEVVAADISRVDRVLVESSPRSRSDDSPKLLTLLLQQDAVAKALQDFQIDSSGYFYRFIRRKE